MDLEINYHHFACLCSTSTWSKENYKNFDQKKITLVTADQQTAGRGHYKRLWLSPPEQNIYATFTFFLDKGRKDLNNIAQVLALSAVKTLEKLNFHPTLKWPNDIQINKKKVGGVLCEMITDEDHCILLMGIGININMPLETLQQIDQPATSLMVERGKHLPIDQTIQSLQNHFVQDLALFLREGFSPFLEDYRKHIVHVIGDTLKIGEQKVTFKAINSDGALVIQDSNGKEQKLYAGEITG